MASFVIPEKKGRLQEEDKRFGEEQIRELVEEQMKDVKTRVSDAVDETIQYAVEKTERSMERVTNEKIMAVNEYSDTVLEEIHKNHEEVVFLYDMLNDKQQNIKDTAAAVEKKAKEVRRSMQQEEIETVQGGGQQDASVQNRDDGKEDAKPAFVPLNAAEQETVSGQADIIRIAAPAGGSAVENSAAWDAAAKIDEALISEAKRSVLQSVIAQNPAAQHTAPQDEAEQNMAPQDVVPQNETEQTGSQKSDGQAEHAKAGKAKKRASGKEADPAGMKERRSGMPAVGLSFASPGEEGRNNNEKILSLHKAGKSNMAIAKELGLGIGEVKLVIDLFKGV